MTNRDDLNQLLNALIPYAQQMLSQQGQVMPFAAAINTAGEVQVLGGYPSEESSSMQDIQDVLVAQLQAGAREGKYRATGMCSDVRVRRDPQEEPTDALALTIEHSDGSALNVFLPYSKQAGGRITYGDMFGGAGQSRVFPPPPPA